MIWSFLRLSSAELSSASVIITIPVVVIGWGCSAGIRNHDNIAPNSGIMNFHRFRSETTIPGLFNRVIQMEIAIAESRLSHISDIK